MKSNRKLLISLLLSAIAALSPVAASAASSPMHARHAMVVSINGFASAAGIEVLKRGGNAVDAAVAVGFALAVVHPQAGNIGGGGFMLLRLATGDTHFIDFRETAPAAATEKMYQDAQGNLLPDASTIGYKAIAIPSSVAGLTYAQKKFGKLPLGTVMARLRMAGPAATAPGVWPSLQNHSTTAKPPRPAGSSSTGASDRRLRRRSAGRSRAGAFAGCGLIEDYRNCRVGAGGRNHMRAERHYWVALAEGC